MLSSEILCSVLIIFYGKEERVIVNAACITKSRLPMKQLD